MNKQLTRGLVAVAGIILISVCLARGCANSESVADYAANHEVVQPEIEKIDNEQIVADSSLENEQIAPSASVETEKIPEDGSEGTEMLEKENSADDQQNANDTNDSALEETVQRTFYIEEIDDELKAKMQGKSYADNIDETLVNYSMLRHVVINYYDFDNETQIGEIVCNEKIAQDILEIFEELYDSGYQLERVHLIDEYDADDDASMDANNTSCFNYRVVDNTTKLSQHAYGLAIDVNPFYNPYVQMRNGEEYVCPTGSVPYANRQDNFPYKIDENDLAYKLFKQHGFIWGGNWNSCKDYQHFEKRFK